MGKLPFWVYKIGNRFGLIMNGQFCALDILKFFTVKYRTDPEPRMVSFCWRWQAFCLSRSKRKTDTKQQTTGYFQYGVLCFQAIFTMFTLLVLYLLIFFFSDEDIGQRRNILNRTYLFLISFTYKQFMVKSYIFLVYLPERKNIIVKYGYNFWATVA